MGRFFWGTVSDRIGRVASLVAIFLQVGPVLFALTRTITAAAFLLGILGVGISFGGLMGVFPELCIERFGTKYFGINYGLMFTGYSVAELFDPRLGAAIGDAHGGYFDIPYIIAAGLSLLGAIVAIAFRVHTCTR